MKNLIARLMGTYLNFLSLVAPARAAQKGFLLFCRPFRGKINQKQLEFFNSADKFSFNHNEAMIQGYRWGRGSKKVIFFHGWQSHTYRWKNYIESLSKEEYTIYSIDAPGHGLSGGNFLSVPLYSEIIQKFILDQGEVHTVVGHSIGGFSLLYTFYNFPLMPVRKMILMAPPGEASDFIGVFRNTLGLSERTMKLMENHFVSAYGVGPEFFSTEKFARSVNIPGLIIHDLQDLEAPYYYAQKINEAWRKSVLITTDGMGHNLKSSTVVDHVVGFINETSPSLARV
jgi:pimeloyl-ACP methyl ester carboxylesterase